MFDQKFHQQVDLVLTILGYMDWDECYAMKGGTALNFFYEQMPRLSIDIDLVYLPVNSREEAIKEMNVSFQKYISMFKKRGFAAQIIGVKSNNPLGRLYVSNGVASIKIEPNLVIRGALLPPKLKSLSSAVKKTFSQDLKVRCLDYNEIMAGKLAAMLDRQHPRDIFDLLHYYKHHRSLKDFMDCFVVYLLQSSRPFSELLKPRLLDIKEIFKTNFEGMANYPVDLKDLLSCRDKVIKNVQDSLGERRLEFLISVMEEKPKWDLIPFDNLDKLPGIKWKLQNIHSMAKSKREAEIKKLRKG
ncbi:MAG: nucleotidyl transferase AbiEii/AbiGii toxin family protein [Candidatus Omnitrophica bacterium]|nr:nucleotidyl transferase AbiEii/AbiGii toxin family protein [Candidatus Omnitrophota bacterium]MDE2009886.1 nucleotidyl transferase AbiEii/AbiGii toxin family protein [Candidatus Omnitrophota bacterium]MDE2214332.1 nucleotidyl transferase AbiEii/AbiGii toxin family protein [Candidatus Omnitrophota bacterium]MDE2231081.1 nucleotidyl transferase AbiEii/AbiGii toxin family protein [Candidatus Omnitrophota bacterium]